MLTAEGAGAASQQSLGTAVFGGMLASTFLAIPFVPVFYVVLHPLRRRSRLSASWSRLRAVLGRQVVSE